MTGSLNEFVKCFFLLLILKNGKPTTCAMTMTMAMLLYNEYKSIKYRQNTAQVLTSAIIIIIVTKELFRRDS